MVDAQTPSISAQPGNKTVNVGGSADLSVTAAVTDGGTLSYQWYSNTTNSNTGGTPIAGDEATYAAPTTAAGTTYYYVVVTNTNTGVSGAQTATATSNVATVTVNALVDAQTPSISGQPSDKTVNVGGSADLTVTAAVTDGGTLSYQWYSNTTSSNAGGTPIAGADEATYAAPTTAAGTTYYYVAVTNTNADASGAQTATATSDAAKVTVNALVDAQTPSISAQPGDKTVDVGGGADLTVTAAVTDGGTLSYQWYSNTTSSNAGGTPIADANAATYAAPTTAAGTTYYYVVVTNTKTGVSGNPTATKTSNVATVTVNALVDAQTPSISAQPGDKTVNVGDNADLTVTAAVTDGGTLSYQWYSNTTSSNAGGTPIADADEATYAAPTTAAGTTYYYVVVTNTKTGVSGNPTATATSDAAKVTVNALVDAQTPNISAQPGDKTVNVGGSADLRVTAAVTDGGTLSYQWYSNTTNSNAGGTPIADANAATYAAPTTAAGTTYYYVVVTNTNTGVSGAQTATATSDAAKVTVNALVDAQTPNISAQPGDKTVNVGGSADLSVTAAVTDGGTLSYQWYSNTTNSNAGGTPIADANAATYAAPTTAAGTTYYYVVVTNTNTGVSGAQTATATSDAAKVTVNALVDAQTPNISAQPGDKTVNVGDNADLSVTAAVTDGGTLSYQWYSNTTSSNAGGTPIADANAATYAAPTTAAGTTYYYVVVTNTKTGVSGSQTATVTSEAATVTVNALVDAQTPSISAQPGDKTVDVGGSADLSVTAAVTDGGTLSYQWYSNTTNSNTGGTPIADANAATYAAPTTAAGTTYYYVVVTNTNTGVSGAQTATATSDAAKVTVNALPTYMIGTIANQAAAPLTEGYATSDRESKTISIDNTGTGNLTNLSAALTSGDTNAFELTQPAGTLNSGDPATSFTVTAKDGLTAGTYTATITLSADNLTDVTFTVTQVVNLPDAPTVPQQLMAQGGNRVAALNWQAVTGADSYKVYMGTTSGQYGSEPVTTVNGTSAEIGNLTNGTDYYFAVTAGNAGGWSDYSNEANTTPMTVPGAPTAVAATAGNGQATIVFTAPSDDGGSAITGYEVTASPGGRTATGAASPIIVTGLTNGTSYSFTVKAVNAVGNGAESDASPTVVPSAPSTGGTIPAEASDTDVEVLVNGKVEKAGKAIITRVNNKKVTTVEVDPDKLNEKLASEGDHAVVTIPVNTDSNVVIGELNGQMVKNMEQKQAIVKIQTNNASYTLPAQQIDIDAISSQVGDTVALSDIKIRIRIAEPSENTVQIVQDAASQGGFGIVAPPLDFSVEGSYGDKTIEVHRFNAYVERTIAIPDGIDPNRITTGIVIDPDGSVRHVPTRVTETGGTYYAQISSLTNSTYSVVWHPIEFSDVASHWAQNAVNDMGSRMVVDGTGDGRFNPNRTITRAEFAAIVVRALGLKEETGTSAFADVQSEEWYSGAIQTAYAYKLINGFEDGLFHPTDTITREQAMAIVSKAMSLTGLKASVSTQSTDELLDAFADGSKISPWAKLDAAAVLEAGVVKGKTDKELAPQDLLTRAEVAVMMERLLQKSGLI